MLIWRGNGGLVLAIIAGAVALGWVTGILIESLAGITVPEVWRTNGALLIASALLMVFGRRWHRAPAGLDGEALVAFRHLHVHSFYHIKVEHWAVLLLIYVAATSYHTLQSMP